MPTNGTYLTHVVACSEAEVAEEFLSPGFLLLGQHKVPLAKRIIGFGVDVVMTDVDTGQACLYSSVRQVLKCQRISGTKVADNLLSLLEVKHPVA